MIRAVVAWPVDAFRIPDDTSTSTSTATRDDEYCKYRRSPMRSLRELANGPRPVPPRARPRAGGGLVYTMRSRRRPAHAFSAHRSPQPRSPGSAALFYGVFLAYRTFD